MIKRFVFAAAAMTAVLCSCNEKGKDYEPLTSDAQELNLTVGESAVVSVSGGSGEIEVFSEDETVAVAVAGDSGAVTVSALAEGRTGVNISDVLTGEELRVDISVLASLSLSAVELTVNEGESASVDILSGSGDYSVSVEKGDIASAAIEGNKVIVTGLKEGSTSMSVKDNASGAEASVEVTVEAESVITFHSVYPFGDLMILLDAPENVREKVWIDLDGDGQMQEGEKVTVFGEYVTYPFIENVSVYGPVTEFGATLMQIDDIALSGNPHLERLDLSMCNLTDVDLSANVNLKWLDVQNNSQLEKLDVSHNAKLTYLSCSAVKITELDLSGNPELVEVHCIMTQAERIELGDITKIENLNIWNNYLTEIDLSHLSALKDLNVAGNELTSLDVSSNTALRTLNFSMMSSVGTVDLSMCGELEELYAYECGLKNVDFMKNLPNPDKLKILMVNKNPELSEMDLTGFTGLVTIHCYECAIAGDAMTALVESLPEREESDQAKIYIINTSFFPGVVEANEITDEQVEIAKAKNWQPYNQYTGASPIPLFVVCGRSHGFSIFA